MCPGLGLRDKKLVDGGRKMNLIEMFGKLAVSTMHRCCKLLTDTQHHFLQVNC